MDARQVEWHRPCLPVSDVAADLNLGRVVGSARTKVPTGAVSPKFLPRLRILII